MPHGRSWRVLKPREFEIRVIPKFFEHSKFSSFVRQANGWGFRRITQGPDRNSYYNELFLRGLPHLCKKMKRPGVAEKDFLDPKHEPDFYKISEMYPLPIDEHKDESISYQVSSSQGPRERIPVNFGAFDASKPEQCSSVQVSSFLTPNENNQLKFDAIDGTKSFTREVKGQKNSFAQVAETPEKSTSHSQVLPNHHQHRFTLSAALNDTMKTTPSYYGAYQQMANRAIASTDARPPAESTLQGKARGNTIESIQHFVQPTGDKRHAGLAVRGTSQGNFSQMAMPQFLNPVSHKKSAPQTLSVACHLNSAANHLQNVMNLTYHQQLHSTNKDRDLAMQQFYRQMFHIRQNNTMP